MQFEPLADRARGRWLSILPAVGVSERFLVNRPGPCPACGGKDRFRFDNKGGNGTFYCNGCGAGTGVDLVMRVKMCNFKEAARMIEQHIPTASISIPRAAAGKSNSAASIWAAARPLTGMDPASLYLARRGFTFDTPPSCLRFMPNAKFTAADRITTSRHPAMIARFDSPDACEITCHMTYLTSDGRKAQVNPAKKLAPGPVPPGGSVRLGPAAETIGIAEGIETALGASRLHGMPVWAALSDGALVKWVPPAIAKRVVILGDNDKNGAGQAAAWNLYHRLATDKRWANLEIDVVLPETVDTDWADVWLAQSKTAELSDQTDLGATDAKADDQRPGESEEAYVARIFGCSPDPTSSQLEVIS